MALTSKEVLVLGVVIVFSVSLLVFAFQLKNVYTMVPLYACYYGVWSGESTGYLTRNDPHVVRNGSSLVRMDDFDCKKLFNASSFSVEDCNSSVPWFSYDSSELVGFEIMSYSQVEALVK